MKALSRLSRWPRSQRNERGMSISVLFAACLPAFIMLCGLVIDGAAQLSAQRSANIVAAQAARAGSDAAAGSRLAGSLGQQQAVSAALSVLDSNPGIDGSCTLSGSGVLSVQTSSSVDTVFLGLIGIDQLSVTGQAQADLRQPEAPTSP